MEITNFGSLDRIYILFSMSTHGWDIYTFYCDLYTVIEWSETRWENRINTEKAIRFQINNEMHALYGIFKTSNDPIITFEANSLLEENENFEFLLSLIIWYELLTEVNVASKNFQNFNMQLDVLPNMLNGLVVFLEKYRENVVEVAIVTIKLLTISIEVELMFKQVRFIKKATELVRGP